MTIDATTKHHRIRTFYIMVKADFSVSILFILNWIRRKQIFKSGYSIC